VKATGSMTVGATPACAAAAASTTPTLTVNTALTNITHATTIATGIGIAIGLPAGVIAAWSADVITISGTPTALGPFSYTIPLTGTSCSSVNATGTITVSAPSFTCGTSTVPDNEGNTYNTVLIGTQCWTTTNLRVTKYNDGTVIPDETANTAGWGLLATGARSDYTGEASYIATYGYLYNWYAATDSRNICPTGWHVPTDSDWNKLIRSIDSGADTTGTSTQSTTAGGKMKSTGDNTAGTGLWNSPNTGADNASGFTALPGGFRSSAGSFYNISYYAFFWSAAEDDKGTNAWFRSLNYNGSNVFRSSYN
jgi:uncharacterized protein (TIGR02145 family)